MHLFNNLASSLSSTTYSTTWYPTSQTPPIQQPGIQPLNAPPIQQPGIQPLKHYLFNNLASNISSTTNPTTWHPTSQAPFFQQPQIHTSQAQSKEHPGFLPHSNCGWWGLKLSSY
jgi:hypothetical protein